MTAIIDLPTEVFEQVVVDLDPIDVSSLTRTCRTFHAIIDDPNNRILWRNLYLAQPFDDLRRCVTPLGCQLINIDWKARLQSIIRARTIVRNVISLVPAERIKALQTLLDMAGTVVPLPDPNSDELSLNHAWLVALLRNGSFLDSQDSLLETSPEERQLRARLHVYFGLTTIDRQPYVRVLSRAYVYAMRNYRAENDYGPFLKDGSGRVDWVHVQHIHHVIAMHIVSRAPTISQYPLIQLSLPFCQPVIPPGLDLDDTEDWAGVAGYWRCSFCFCDHRDLLEYNNNDESDIGYLSTQPFESPDFVEIFSGANMQLRVTSYEDDPAHPTRPITHFAGGSENQSYVQGWVKLIAEDQIRWHFESGQPGELVWSSEGIQIGSVRSSYGVLGAWTTVQHDRGDPVGPFLMRKMSHITVNVEAQQ
ncbi:hypothetical protein NM688_g1607 [Phlebia brevispora]|uniref:Uncharacterized protein n=1 Tax=Phlebia brevispora TaxID=194682 RepID=A0ACC1TB45_9APHY|nr:hypothetical protein NM688_g1607 [Phlebia brevispora]